MAKKKGKRRPVIWVPKWRGKLSPAEIDRMIDAMMAAREQRKKERAASDGKK